MAHALLAPGQENSGRLVTLLKKKAQELALKQNRDWIICDGSPGVGCPVISSLSGAHLAIAVVEPTPSGRHDFGRLAELCAHFRIPMAVIINKADLNASESASIAELATRSGGKVVGEIPFDEAMIQAMIQKKAITETSGPLAETMRRIWSSIAEMAATTGRPKLVPLKKNKAE